MAKALEIIQQEHRRLSAVLHCLENVIRDIDARGTAPDFTLLHSMIHYICAFLFRFHHPKEDFYLFDALRRRHSDAIPLLEQLAQEHKRGDELIEECRQALLIYEREGDGAFESFRRAVDAYLSLETTHMMVEEREIIPQAREFLTEEDWAEADAAFLDNEDPLFGEKPTKEFQRLFVKISDLAPLPHECEVLENTNG